jgi:glycosyltransferase involved in cell wall biosynthesis
LSALIAIEPTFVAPIGGKLRIAQISPLTEAVPPKLYGGTERVVSYLTEELVASGHDVTLFASADSTTNARLIPCCPEALRLNPNCADRLAHHYVMLDEVMERAEEFDVIHFHIDYLHFPLSRLSGMPQLTTLHGRLDLPDLLPLYKKYTDMPVVSISKAQRKPLPFLNWICNIYHGLPTHRLPLGEGGGNYLAFLGRISPEKRVDRAIQIALEVGMPLKIAAKIDQVDREYFETKIKSLLDSPGIEYMGEITEDRKPEFLGNAYAYLFPIDWPEPFGLTMIESMACGTPTVAFGCGSVPELITDGVSGFVVDNMADAVKAVEQVATLDRAACRRAFEARFSVSRMADDYVKLYKSMLSVRSSVETPELDTFLTR